MGIPGSSPPLPAAVREALRREAKPVRPVLPTGLRAFFVILAALATAALFLGLWGRGLRPDRQSLGPVLLWLPALIRVAAGAALVLLAMREGIPGLGARPPLRMAVLFGMPLLLVLLAEGLAAGAPEGGMPMMREAMAGRGVPECFSRELLVAVPAMLLLGLLLVRAYPLRPVFAAVAGAFGVGLLADAALHLTCPSTALSHTLLVHGGAVAALTAAAAMSGWAFGRLRLHPRPSL